MQTAMEWATSVFGKTQLGNKLRTRRLVEVAASLAVSPGATVNASARGNQALAEGAARLLRNPHFDADGISEGGFDHTLSRIEDGVTYLGVEDTTTTLYKHASVSGELGFVNGPEDRSRGWHWQSTLLIEETSGSVVGLLDQQRWMRFATKAERGKQSYEDGEGSKWQSTSERIAAAAGPKMKQIIMVADRESDIYAYLAFKSENEQRFVVRGRFDRKQTTGQRIMATLAPLPKAATIEIEIPQRDNRKARTATAEVRFMEANIASPANSKKLPFSLNVVWVKELGRKSQDALEWLLYTSEPVRTVDDALRIIAIYRKRWIVEDFHRAWKTGCKVEERRQQFADNLEKVAVILAFVAIRLLQLRHTAAQAPDAECTVQFDDLEWRVLYKARYPNKPLPKKTPPLRQAMEEMARLGGWTDTQRTGKIGWETLWKGRRELDDLTRGVRIAQHLKLDQ